MPIKASDTKHLIAITQDGEFISISNKVLRKLQYPGYQKKMPKKSICICCNYSFKDRTRGWHKKIAAICHPYKDTSIFPDDKNLYLFSESDFVDKMWVPIETKSYSKKYDFVYFTIDSVQGINCKGYHALPAIANAAAELGMKGLVIDYLPRHKRKPSYRGFKRGSKGHDVIKTKKRIRRLENIKIMYGPRSQKSLAKIMAISGFVLFPNTKDSSPRMITESLIRGTPILVNNGIYGGWKYVDEVNGLLFDGPDNRKQLDDNRDYYHEEFKKALLYMKKKDFDRESIQKQYYSKYGLFNSARTLAEIFNEIEGKNKYKYVMYKEFSKIIKKHWKKFDQKNKDFPVFEEVFG